MLLRVYGLILAHISTSGRSETEVTTLYVVWVGVCGCVCGGVHACVCLYSYIYVIDIYVKERD